MAQANASRQARSVEANALGQSAFDFTHVTDALLTQPLTISGWNATRVRDAADGPAAEPELEHELRDEDSSDELDAQQGDEVSKREDVELMANNAMGFIEWFLEWHLYQLTTRGAVELKRDILEWIFAKEADGYVWDLRDSSAQRRVPVLNKNVPFTYQWVCRALSLDGDVIRSGVMRALQRLVDTAQTTQRRTNLADALAHAKMMKGPAR